MSEPLLEISLYFDERIDPATQQPMSLQEVADKLTVYPAHLFKREYDLTFDYMVTRPYDTRGLLVLYAYLVAEQHQAWLEQMQCEGYLKSWAVFPPGTRRGYFKRREKASIRE